MREQASMFLVSAWLRRRYRDRDSGRRIEDAVMRTLVSGLTNTHDRVAMSGICPSSRNTKKLRFTESCTLVKVPMLSRIETESYQEHSRPGYPGELTRN